MKMFLTRIGFGSKVIITGDKTQKDLPGGAVSGLYLGIMKVGYYSFGPSNVLSVIGFVSAEKSANFINGCIAAALAFVVTLVAMLVLYKDKDEAPKGK